MYFRRKSPLNSISFKVLLAFIIGVVLSITLILLVVSVSLFSRSNIFSASDISDYTKILSNELVFNEQGIPVAIRSDNEDHMPWLFESLKKELAYRVYNESGNAVLYSAAGPKFWPNKENNESFEFEYNGVLFDGASHLVDNNGSKWIVQAAVSRRFMDFSHKNFSLRFVKDSIAIFSVVLLLVFGFCAHFTLRHTLKPLRELSESALAISPRALQARLHQKNIPSEIAPLVNSFNLALDRLEHGYRIQQTFLTTAAHELKTPLSLIRAQLELMIKTEENKWLLHDVTYMSRQVQQLLLLAETSELHNYKIIEVDMLSIIKEVTSYLQRVARNAQVNLIVKDYSAERKYFADKGAFFTLLKNILENAIQHSPPNSDVVIVLSPNEITVRDWGMGVNEEQLPLLFTPFWRGDHRRDIGAGLGLSICQEIAMAHGWSLSAKRMSHGLLFQLLYIESFDSAE